MQSIYCRWVVYISVEAEGRGLPSVWMTQFETRCLFPQNTTSCKDKCIDLPDKENRYVVGNQGVFSLTWNLCCYMLKKQNKKDKITSNWIHF